VSATEKRTVTFTHGGAECSAVVTRRVDDRRDCYVYDVDWIDPGGHEEDRALNNMAVDAFLAEVPES
jgi:hypothetical protein